MRTLSFIKFSPSGEYWLQDEIYDLYDRRHGHTGASAAEIRERKRVYDKVIQYLDGEIRKYEGQLLDFWRQDRRQLLMEAGHEAARQGDLSPLQIEMIRFAPRDRLEPEEGELRVNARNALESLLLDSLYFRLRLNPLLAFNNDYHEMADTAWVEYDDDFMMQLQIQLRRFLEDDLAWQFSVEEKPFVLQGGESVRVLLERLARQDAAIRELKRLHMRGNYAGVLAYADAIRKHAENLRGDERAVHSWNHTVTRSEICIYESYARIYFGGKEAEEATVDLKGAAKELEYGAG